MLSLTRRVAAAVLVLPLLAQPWTFTATAAPSGEASFTRLPEDDAVVLRATAPELPDAIVAFVAENAEPTRLNPVIVPDAPERSAEEVLSVMCGTISSRYRQLLLSMNDLPLDFDFEAPLRERAYSLSWPACFYVRNAPVDVTLQRGSLSQLYLDLTGGRGDRGAWAEYFQRGRLNHVGRGESFVAPFTTRATPFRPMIDAEDFVIRLRQLAAQAGAQNLINTSPSAAPIIADGEIIVAKSEGFADGSGAYVPPGDCRAVTGPAYNLELVKRAYKTAAALQSDNQISVAVVDNGFYGARQNNGELKFAEQFAARFFNIVTDPDGADSIGPQVETADGAFLHPLNSVSVPGSAADFVSGHGTHVAGLIIGGEGAGAGSGLYDLNGEADAWLKMTIVPLSPGRRSVSTTALKSLAALSLNSAKLMNLSVRYGPNVAQAMRELVRNNPTRLFVVAAGNDGRDVVARSAGEVDIFPAALGGQESRNVVTVAADDSRGNLTDFTNTSSDYVDIAAPGCNIASWIDGTRSVRLSGTSQAAPLVSFTAALLAHKKLSPYQIKRRLLLSGDILSGRRHVVGEREVIVTSYNDDDEVPIFSRSHLNIPKALYFAKDYIRYTVGQGVAQEMREALGTVSAVGSVRCGRKDVAAPFILALKRSPPGGLWCFPKRALRPLRASAGSLTLTFTIETALRADGEPDPTIAAGTTIQVDPAQLEEFIRSDRSMTLAEGES